MKPKKQPEVFILYYHQESLALAEKLEKTQGPKGLNIVRDRTGYGL